MVFVTSLATITIEPVCSFSGLLLLFALSSLGGAVLLWACVPSDL